MTSKIDEMIDIALNNSVKMQKVSNDWVAAWELIDDLRASNRELVSIINEASSSLTDETFNWKRWKKDAASAIAKATGNPL